jgi:serine/threonine-protein kinase RsbW/stage II sporulation protein AB (anti-sigma F factor)
VDLRLPARAESVAYLRQAVTRFAVITGVHAPDDVALAVSEALTNAVVHAYRDRAEGQIRVVACDEPDRLVVVVRDYGCGMSPRHDSPGLGLGLPLMTRTASMTNIEMPADGGTRVRMHFTKRETSPASARPDGPSASAA